MPESHSSTVRILTLPGGDRAVLKIPFNRVKLQRELDALTRLRGILPVPGILDWWEGDADIPGAMLLSLLEGQPLPDGTAGTGLASQMGEMLGTLHGISMPGYGSSGPDGEFVALGEDWWSNVRRRLETWLERARPHVEQGLLDLVLGVYRDLEADLPPPDGPCLIHRDYRPGNIMVRGGTVSGLLDFESAGGGPADADFTKMSLYLWDRCPGTREAFLNGYSQMRSVPDLDTTLPLYRLANAIGGLAWGVDRGSIEFFNENLGLLRKEMARYR